MLMIKPVAIAVCAAVILSGCGVSLAMKASPEREAETDALLADFGAGRGDAIIGKMSSQASPDQVRAQLPFMKNLVPAGAVPAGNTVGWQSFTGTGGTTYSLNRAYDYPDRTLAVSATWRKEGAGWKVLNFNINIQVKPGATAPAKDGEMPVVVPGTIPVEAPPTQT